MKYHSMWRLFVLTSFQIYDLWRLQPAAKSRSAAFLRVLDEVRSEQKPE
jgi:hypothetical protein